MQDYSEAYDNVTNAYMTQGRFKNSHVVEVFYFSSGVVFSWDSRDPDNTCTFIGWADYPQKEQVTPSVWMLSNLTSGSIKYTNRTLDVRFILTDGFNVTFPGSTYLVNFAPGTTPGVDQAPVRIEKLVYGNNGQIAERELYVCFFESILVISLSFLVLTFSVFVPSYLIRLCFAGMTG